MSRRGTPGRICQCDLQSLGASAEIHKLRGPLDHFGKIELDVLQLHLSRFDFGKVEYVVDDGEQGFAAAAKDADKFLLLRIERGLPQQVSHAKDRVHRSADLVTHPREKLALGLRRPLQFATEFPDPVRLKGCFVGVLDE